MKRSANKIKTMIRQKQSGLDLRLLILLMKLSTNKTETIIRQEQSGLDLSLLMFVYEATSK